VLPWARAKVSYQERPDRYGGSQKPNPPDPFGSKIIQFVLVMSYQIKGTLKRKKIVSLGIS
jgi:hypothetical protein